MRPEPTAQGQLPGLPIDSPAGQRLLSMGMKPPQDSFNIMDQYSSGDLSWPGGDAAAGGRYEGAGLDDSYNINGDPNQAYNDPTGHTQSVSQDQLAHAQSVSTQRLMPEYTTLKQTVTGLIEQGMSPQDPLVQQMTTRLIEIQEAMKNGR